MSRFRKSLYRRGRFGLESLAKASICSLPEVETALEQERACKRPRAKFLRALTEKATWLRSRKDLLDTICVTKVLDTCISPHDALQYAGAADRLLILVPGEARAEYIEHAALLGWLANVPAGARVKVYSCAGSCYFGLRASTPARAKRPHCEACLEEGPEPCLCLAATHESDFSAGTSGGNPAVAARGERPEVETSSPRANSLEGAAA